LEISQMVRMTAEEARRLAEEIYGKEQMGNVLPISNDADEKIPAADVDAAPAGAHVSAQTSPVVKRGFWRNIVMALTGEQKRKAYLREKEERERQRTALTIVRPSAVVVPQATGAVASETTPAQSPTNVQRFDNREAMLGEWRPIPEIAPATNSESPRSWILGLTSGALGLGLATVGLVVNARVAGSTSTGLDGHLLSAWGLCIDAGAVIGLSVSTALWRNRHRLASFVFCGAWLGCVAISTIQTSGFASKAFGDAAAGRGAVIETATHLREQRTSAINIAKDAVKLAKSRTERQDANRQLATANATPVIATVSISAADPGPHMLADLLGVSEHLIQRIRLGGFAIAPIILASLFLMASTMLLSRRR
jgi:hypothetical protein